MGRTVVDRAQGERAISTRRSGDGSPAGKVLLFGGVVVVGSSMYQYLTDTWEWDGDTWTERNVSGPIGVSDAAMSSR